MTSFRTAREIKWSRLLQIMKSDLITKRNLLIQNSEWNARSWRFDLWICGIDPPPPPPTHTHTHFKLHKYSLNSDHPPGVHSQRRKTGRFHAVGVLLLVIEQSPWTRTLAVSNIELICKHIRRLHKLVVIYIHTLDWPATVFVIVSLDYPHTHP